MSAAAAQGPAARLAEVWLVFTKLGLTSFGGPIAHLGYFRRELVLSRNWVSESRFAQLLALCQFLPGPTSSQLGFALGLQRAGWPGALAACIAFTLPSAVIMYACASLLPAAEPGLVDAVIGGLKLVACVLVADALLGMAGKLCPRPPEQLLACVAAAGMLLFGSVWTQLLLIIGGGLAGLVWLQAASEPAVDRFLPAKNGKNGKTVGLMLPAFCCLLAAGLPLLPGPEGELAASFFRSGALVFGGGHVVLPLLQESLVATGRMEEDVFLAGYGAAQALPGPLFAFAAYLGALLPGTRPLTGALLALVCIFLPGFLLLAGILPFWQSWTRKPAAGRAVAGVNAAVVGLLAATFYDPVFTGSVLSAADLAVAVGGFTLVSVLRLSPLYALAWCLLLKLPFG